MLGVFVYVADCGEKLVVCTAYSEKTKKKKKKKEKLKNGVELEN